jgi:CTP synthase (UTP-ammonia lyase)
LHIEHENVRFDSCNQIVNASAMTTPRIGIIGEFNPNNPLHLATNAAITHSWPGPRVLPAIEWLPTDKPVDLRRFAGFWCSPGGPYKSLMGALEMIRWARVERKPFMGTCAGFQHAILEFARNVLGIKDAMHAEYEPDTPMPFIRPLSCSLVGKKLAIRLKPGSQAAAFYGATEVTEAYYCNFGLNPNYREPLEAAGLVISGWDETPEAPSPANASTAGRLPSREAAEVRVVELPDHPFFLGTLFVPQAASTPERPHPLSAAFTSRIAGLA